jgi:hypothetical protein
MAFEPIAAPAHSAAERLWFNNRLERTQNSKSALQLTLYSTDAGARRGYGSPIISFSPSNIFASSAESARPRRRPMRSAESVRT